MPRMSFSSCSPSLFGALHRATQIFCDACITPPRRSPPSRHQGGAFHHGSQLFLEPFTMPPQRSASPWCPVGAFQCAAPKVAFAAPAGCRWSHFTAPLQRSPSSCHAGGALQRAAHKVAFSAPAGSSCSSLPHLPRGALHYAALEEPLVAVRMVW